jgi:hypothetical protein
MKNARMQWRLFSLRNGFCPMQAIESVAVCNKRRSTQECQMSGISEKDRVGAVLCISFLLLLLSPFVLFCGGSIASLLDVVDTGRR